MAGAGGAAAAEKKAAAHVLPKRTKKAALRATPLTKYYEAAFRQWEKPAILDICASHVSHFSADVADYAGRRVALGMNKDELSQNKQVTEFVVKDLNA